MPGATSARRCVPAHRKCLGGAGYQPAPTIVRRQAQALHGPTLGRRCFYGGQRNESPHAPRAVAAPGGSSAGAPHLGGAQDRNPPGEWASRHGIVRRPVGGLLPSTGEAHPGVPGRAVAGPANGVTISSQGLHHRRYCLSRSGCANARSHAGLRRAAWQRNTGSAAAPKPFQRDPRPHAVYVTRGGAGGVQGTYRATAKPAHRGRRSHHTTSCSIVTSRPRAGIAEASRFRPAPLRPGGCQDGRRSSIGDARGRRHGPAVGAKAPPPARIRAWSRQFDEVQKRRTSAARQRHYRCQGHRQQRHPGSIRPVTGPQITAGGQLIVPRWR